MAKVSILQDKSALEKAINESSSIKEVLQKLGLRAAGGNYKQLQKHSKELGLKLPQWSYKDSLNKNKIKLPDEVVFVEDSKYGNSHQIKLRMIAMGVPYRCNNCGLGDMWNDKPIILQLEHNDNRLENLEILCPNCHSQTDTYAGRKTLEDKAKSKRNKKCISCDELITKQAIRCRICNANNRQKVIYPSYDTLNRLVKEKGYSAVGRELGVSDNAIKKHLSNHGKL